MGEEKGKSVPAPAARTIKADVQGPDALDFMGGMQPDDALDLMGGMQPDDEEEGKGKGKGGKDNTVVLDMFKDEQPGKDVNNQQKDKEKGKSALAPEARATGASVQGSDLLDMMGGMPVDAEEEGKGKGKGGKDKEKGKNALAPEARATGASVQGSDLLDMM